MPESISEVLQRVGDHPIRASEALRAERARPNPRKTLVGKLEAIAVSPDEDMPDGLGVAGARFWSESRAKFGFRLDELVLLERACRIIDDLSELDWEKSQLDTRTTQGSQGQLVTHPIIDQIRQANADLRATIKALNFPDESAAEARSSQARKAALARWGG